MSGFGESQNGMRRPGFLPHQKTFQTSTTGRSKAASFAVRYWFCWDPWEKSLSSVIPWEPWSKPVNSLLQTAKGFHTDNPNIRDCGLSPLYLGKQHTCPDCATVPPTSLVLQLAQLTASFKKTDFPGGVSRANHNQSS